MCLAFLFIWNISKRVNAIKDIFFSFTRGYKTMILPQIKIGTIHVTWTYFSIFYPRLLFRHMIGFWRKFTIFFLIFYWCAPCLSFLLKLFLKASTSCLDPFKICLIIWQLGGGGGGRWQTVSPKRPTNIFYTNQTHIFEDFFQII